MNTSSPPRNQFIRTSSKSRKLLWRNNLILFIALMILIFIAPLNGQLGGLINKISLIIVVVSGVFAAEYGKRTLNLLYSLGVLVVLNMLFSILFPDNIVLGIVSFFLVALSLALSTAALIIHISMAETVEKSTLLCAINSYLLLGLVASSMFIIVDLIEPESFTSIDVLQGNLNSYIYFGFVTLSTLGYGDISPITPLARSLSIFVAVTGQLYLVIVMALIIGKYLKAGKNSKEVSE